MNLKRYNFDSGLDVSNEKNEKVYKNGYIYKKNSTGFFRNWKKVTFIITEKCLR
jgi:hypothetical protein